MITVRITGDEAAAATMAGISRRLRYMNPAMENIGEGFRAKVRAQFDAGPWAPLRPFTVMRKGHSTKLFETGGMRTSWTVKGSPGNISITSNHQAWFGSNHGLVGWHQFGTPKMVARPVSLADGKFNSIVVNEISNHIMGA